MPPAVGYALTVNGAAAPPQVLDAIRRIEVEDHASLADMLRLRLAVAVRPDSSGWTLLDDDLFPRLARIGLAVTVGGTAIPLISAYVVEVDARLGADTEGSLLTVVAMDPTVLMHLEEKVKPWPNMMDSDVASAIFSDRAYGFTPVVESTRWSRQEDDHTLVQRGTDIQFLQQLAEANGYECFVEVAPGGAVEGHFHPPRPDTPPQGVLTVGLGPASTVDDFRVRHDMLGPATATAATVDPDDASAQSGQSDQPADADVMGSRSATATDQPRRMLLHSLGMAQAGEVARYAKAVVDRSSWSIVAEGDVNTVAYGGVVKAKRSMLVRGAGPQYSGRYYVERVLHVIDGNGVYTQRVTLRRNAVGLTGQENFRGDDARAS